VIFDERKDAQVLRSLCLSALEKIDAAAVFGGEDGKFNFVIAGNSACEIFAKMKAEMNIRGGGKEVICGTLFENKDRIIQFFNGENI
jgi:hypothetical protein